MRVFYLETPSLIQFVGEQRGGGHEGVRLTLYLILFLENAITMLAEKNGFYAVWSKMVKAYVVKYEKDTCNSFCNAEVSINAILSEFKRQILEKGIDPCNHGITT